MTREDKDSLVEMLAKIPVTETKGSLLSAIGKLLRVIDISENSIMIPTLLKDKCEFDAYEMLTLAKILKASILGHNDLVEFYMSESSSQFNTTSLAHHQQQLALCNGNGGGSGSSAASSSSSNNHNHNATPRPHNNHQQQHNFSHLSPIHQHSATPSLRSSTASESTASSSSTSNSSTPMPTPSADSLGDTSSSSSNGAGGGGGGGLSLTNGLMMNGHHHHNGHNHHHLRHNNSSNNNNHNLIHANGSGNQNSCNRGLQLQRMQLGQNGDPDATVRLLLQIEQLKVFIPHVTGIFESIIELYKSSVDAITYGGSSLSGHK